MLRDVNSHTTRLLLNTGRNSNTASTVLWCPALHQLASNNTITNVREGREVRNQRPGKQHLPDIWSSAVLEQGPVSQGQAESRLIRRKFYCYFFLRLLGSPDLPACQASGIKFPWRSSGWSEPYLTDHLTYHNSYLTTTTQHLSNTSWDFHCYGYNRLVWTLVGDVGDKKKQTEHFPVGRQSFFFPVEVLHIPRLS